jgi:uncharacterized membrane protein YtjA (UPF0391 family)
MFACSVTSLAVALVAALLGFTQCIPPAAASVAVVVYWIATAAFVASALDVVVRGDSIERVRPPLGRFSTDDV